MNIPSLRTIKEILSELDFLSYSTRVRNLAYQIQYLDFLLKFFNSYSTYGALRKCLIRQFVATVTNIIEYLLFTSLRQIYREDPKDHRLPSLIGQARGERLIDKRLAGDLNKINDLRNKIHPTKQKHEFDVKSFKNNDINFCNSCFHELIRSLEEHFRSKRIVIDIKTSMCPYGAYHALYFLDDERCPYCGEYGY